MDQPSNACGSCTMCCRVYAIPQLEPAKPAGAWCTHCTIGKGCKIYDQRPKLCVDFECLWLQSQSRENPKQRLPADMRPDRCKVVFSPATDPNIMAAITMPGMSDAWRKGAARRLIDSLVKGGVTVSVGPPAARHRVNVDQRGEHEVEMSEPDADGMQWSIPKKGAA